MKTLVKHVTRAAVIANRNDLVVTCWSPRKVMDLYVGVGHFFDFPCLTYEKRRRTRQCHGRPILVCLTKGKTVWRAMMVPYHVKTACTVRKKIYHNNTKL